MNETWREKILQNAVDRLSKEVNVYSWAMGQLKILNEHSNRQYAEQRCEEIIETLHRNLEEHRKKHREIKEKILQEGECEE